MSLFNETYARANRAEQDLSAALKENTRLRNELKAALNELDTRRMEIVNLKRQMRALPPVAPKVSTEAEMQARVAPQLNMRAATGPRLTHEDFSLSPDEVNQLFAAKEQQQAQREHRLSLIDSLAAKLPGPIAAILRPKGAIRARLAGEGE